MAQPSAYQRVSSEYDITEAGVTSLDYLSFDGADDFMTTANIDINAEHFFLAAEPISFVNGDGFLTAAVNSTNGTEIELVFLSDTTDWLTLSGVTPESGRYRSNGSASVAVGSGVNVYSTDATGYTGTNKLLSGITIGRDRDIPLRHPEFNFFGAIVVDNVLSDTLRDNTEAYLATRSGVSI
jgi:hypothetical protein